MQLIVTEDYAALSRAAADLMADAVAAKPDAAVVLATGNTPMGMYAELAERHQRGEFDTSRLRVFLLDAYLGLAPDDPRSLTGWLERSFIQPMQVPPERFVRLAEDAADPEAACRDYDLAVSRAGGFDFSVLGLGPNGHLGFNEPPADPDSPTRIVDLTEASIVSNSAYWGGRDQVPTRALTAGMRCLLAARQTVLLVSGAHKRDILRRTLEGPISPDVPASYLRQAVNFTVIADRAAAGEG